MLPVADMDTVVSKVLRRLEAVDVPQRMTISLGWDGAKIIANLGDYNKIIKSLPVEHVTIMRGQAEATVSSAILIAVARLQLSLHGKTGKLRGRSPKGGHLWRAQARRDGVARGSGGE